MIVTALAVAALGIATACAQAGPSPRTLNDAASLVAEKPVTVFCKHLTGAEGGLTIIGSNSITVDAARCAAARAAISGRYERPGAEGAALLIVAHESEHARGFRDEVDAECNAVATLPTVLAYINVPRRLRPVMLAGARAADAKLPAAYHAHACSEAPKQPPAVSVGKPLPNPPVACPVVAPSVSIDYTISGLVGTFRIACPAGEVLHKLVWSFSDDGSNAIGATVRHVFAKPGQPLTVTASWIDASFHSQSVSVVVGG